MTTFHESGLFIFRGDRVLLNRLPSGVKSYSIANSQGETIIEQPVYARYKFYPYGNMLVVNLENGNKRIFRYISKSVFEEVTLSYTVKESDLQGEDLLLYHLGLLDQKYTNN